MTGVRHLYSSVASSALSPTANKTGVVWVCTPAIVFGVPAFPMTSTAYKTILCYLNKYFQLFHIN